MLLCGPPLWNHARLEGRTHGFSYPPKPTPSQAGVYKEDLKGQKLGLWKLGHVPVSAFWPHQRSTQSNTETSWVSSIYTLPQDFRFLWPQASLGRLPKFRFLGPTSRDADAELWSGAWNLHFHQSPSPITWMQMVHKPHLRNRSRWATTQD